MKKRQKPRKQVQKKPITVELPISLGVLPWLLDQYSEDQKSGVKEWRLLGIKSD